MLDTVPFSVHQRLGGPVVGTFGHLIVPIGSSLSVTADASIVEVPVGSSPLCATLVRTLRQDPRISEFRVGSRSERVPGKTLWMLGVSQLCVPCNCNVDVASIAELLSSAIVDAELRPQAMTCSGEVYHTAPLMIAS